MRAGIYIHIPFCKSRCIYCGFYSTTMAELHDKYTDCVIREIGMRKNEIDLFAQNSEICHINTLYIGGGTPSTVSTCNVSRIIRAIYDMYPCDIHEITVEVNPDDVTKEYISELKQNGVSRISMGIQTFDDQRLHFLRRRHTALQAKEAVTTIRESGIDNVSIDLMFGFPNETIEQWQSDLDTAVALSPSHISAYSLMYEEGTPLYEMVRKGKITQCDEELSLAMYTTLLDTLTSNGYEHYEISNFALPGKRSIHNSSYWNDTPYLGFGASAHSYNKTTRSWNVADIKEYIKNIEQGILPSEREIIDDDTHYNDMITTALRTKEGIDTSKLKPKYRDYILCNAQLSISSGLLELNGTHLHLTRKGIFVSDMIMSDLMIV